MTALPLIRSAEVAAAQASERPVVALESTIITHGMPYPQNLDVARAVENDLRAGGATPATMAVIEGQLHVGLEDDQLDHQLLTKTHHTAKEIDHLLIANHRSDTNRESAFLSMSRHRDPTLHRAAL